MRVLFVTTGLARSGAEIQLFQLAVSLKQRGYQLRLVSMLEPEALVDELETEGIPVEHLGMKRGVPNPLACVRLARVVREFEPDLVHAHMVHANLLARLTRLICRMPALVCTAQNVHEAPTSRSSPGSYSLRDFLYGATDRLADVTTQVCRAGADRYVRIRATSPERMRLIYNAVDTGKFTSRQDLREVVRREFNAESRWIWLAVGRLEPQKDYPTLLEAFRGVFARCPDSLLLVAGAGRMREELERGIANFNLGRSVVLLGPRKDVVGLMSGADAFVMSSTYEGLPLVLAEAASCELPIVATNVGGNPDVIIDGRTGLLVPSRQPELLGNAMLRVMDKSPGERRQMGRAGRSHVEASFNIHKIVDKWEALYRELTASLKDGGQKPPRHNAFAGSGNQDACATQ